MDEDLLSLNGHAGADQEVLAAIGKETRALPGLRLFVFWFAIAYAGTYYETANHFLAFCVAVALIALWSISVDVRRAHIERRYQAEIAAGMFRISMRAIQRLHDKIDALDDKVPRK